MPNKASALAFINQWFDKVERRKIQPFMLLQKRLKYTYPALENIEV
ncbi:MAG: hypothetical protein HFP78_00960 [Methylococcales symbiont of Hymedesmia sp. n. MRB-2018]|nr:MAG: hypothetical protein HFP78_00960 [Methylococcales symbiont of Hymedesmia sp. n. MRB-2018]